LCAHLIYFDDRGCGCGCRCDGGCGCGCDYDLSYGCGCDYDLSYGYCCDDLECDLCVFLASDSFWMTMIMAIVNVIWTSMVKNSEIV